MPPTDDQFFEVIDRAPLVSLDLIVKDVDGKVLLGLRTKEPAKDTWFVPGGSIQKGETLDSAFERITEQELGVKYSRGQARFRGPYEHLYDTNFLERPNVGTHYVVLAYDITLKSHPDKLPTVQHREWRWFTRAEAAQMQTVHRNVAPYFDSNPDDTTFLAQYSDLNSRRNAYNSLLWQTPVLSLAAQAFLFTIILDGDTGNLPRKAASVLSL